MSGTSLRSTRPSVVLHDHLDGGLRPGTVLELARKTRHDLPAADADALAAWFDQGESGSLERYLDSFAHTVAVMQTAPAIRRVAREAVEDLASDGVIHAEIRFAPFLLIEGGLAPEEVVEAALTGFTEGTAVTGTGVGMIVDHLRQFPDALPAARLAARFAGHGVVGFDLAGPEKGFPPEAHLAAIELAREAGLGITIHAGEAAGLDSIESAVETCGAQRIGHGVEIIDDCVVRDGAVVDMGAVAARIHADRIPLELCPTSNLHTKRWAPEAHPFGILLRAGFAVTLNTDNRLMSATSMSGEFDLARRHFGCAEEDLDRVTETAIGAAFVPEDVRAELRAGVSRASGEPSR